MFRKRTKKDKNKDKIINTIISFTILFVLAYFGDVFYEKEVSIQASTKTTINYNLENIPKYSDNIFVEINNNKPFFDESEYVTEGFEKYSDLDELR